MYIIPRKNYKRIVSSLMASLLLLVLVLTIAVAVMGTRPNLVVKGGLGAYDAKTKTFTPNFDDLNVKEMYQGKVDNKDVGLYYKDVFSEKSPSLSKYSFPKDAFFSLKRSDKETTITLKQSQKKTFKKKGKDLPIKVDWSNILFVSDPKEDLCTVTKTRLGKTSDFSVLNEAFKYRLRVLSPEKTPDEDPFKDYDLATAVIGDEAVKPLFANSNAPDFNVELQSSNKKVERLKIINKASGIKIFSSKKKFDKLGVYTFLVEDFQKKLVDFKEIDSGTNFNISDAYKGKGHTWYKSSELKSGEEISRTESISENKEFKITYSTYFYGIVNTGNTHVSIKVVYEFEDENGHVEKSFAKLKNATTKGTFYGTEPISVTDLDAYYKYQDGEKRRVVKDSEAEWLKESRGYSNIAKVYYKSDVSTVESEVIDNKLPYNAGAKNYTVIFRYDKKTYNLSFKYEVDENTIESISDLRQLGIETTEFKYQDKVTINPYSFNDNTKRFSHWEVRRTINGESIAVPGTEKKTTFFINRDLIGDDSNILFIAKFKIEDSLRKVMLKYYMENENGDYELIQDKSRLLVNGETDCEFTKNEIIANFKDLVEKYMPSEIDAKFEATPEVKDEWNPTKELSINGDVKFDRDDVMVFNIRYKRTRDELKFVPSDGHNEAVLDLTNFNAMFNPTEEVKFGTFVSSETLKKNLINELGQRPKYVFKDVNDIIGTIELLGWKRQDGETEGCDENGFFKLASYKNENTRDKKKTIILYPVWSQQISLYVQVYLGDNNDGDKELSSDRKYKHSYNFIYNINSEFNKEFFFNDADLIRNIKEKAKTEPTISDVLKNNLDTVFEFDNINYDINGQARVVLKKNAKNRFDVYVQRVKSTLRFKLNFKYNNDPEENLPQYVTSDVEETIATLSSGNIQFKNEFERKGLGQVNYVVPEQEMSSAPAEVTDEGKHPIQLKGEIKKFNIPEYLLGGSNGEAVFEAYSYKIVAANNAVIEGRYEALSDVEKTNMVLNSVITVNYKPKEYKITYNVQSQYKPTEAPENVRYLHKAKIGLPRTGNPNDVFLRWVYKTGVDKYDEISQSLIKYNFELQNGKNVVKEAIYTMPAQNVTLHPIFGKAENKKVYVTILTQGIDGEYKEHNSDSYWLKGTYEEEDTDGNKDWFFKAGDTNVEKQADLTKFTQLNPFLKELVGNPEFESYVLAEDFVGDVPNVGTIKLVDGKYRLAINADVSDHIINIKIKFNRYKVRVNFALRPEHADTTKYTAEGMPSGSYEVFVGGGLATNGAYEPTQMKVLIGDKQYITNFRGYSLDDDSVGAEGKRYATDFVFNKDEYKRPGARATLYARWTEINNVDVFGNIRFEKTLPSSYENIGASSSMTFAQKVKVPFDGQTANASAVKPNDLRREMAASLLANHNDTMTPYVADADNIIYDGSNGDDNYSFSINVKNILSYKINRKRVTVSFEMPTGSSPTTFDSEVVLFGAKIKTRPNATYKLPAWGKAVARLKHFSAEKPNYTSNYSEVKPKFDIAGHAFDIDDFVSETKQLYPVWEKAENVSIKLQLKGQKEKGNEFADIQVFESNLLKSDGDAVRVADVIDFVIGKIDGNVYNKDKSTMVFKHNDSEIPEDREIQLTAIGITIEFYLKRNLRTITLVSDKVVNVDKVKGAVQITNDNKTLVFRHGYRFVTDETPTVADTTSERFIGWKTESSAIYEFKNNKEVTSNMTLNLYMEKKDAIVRIKLLAEDPITHQQTRFEGKNLRYDSDGLVARPSGDYITLSVPASKMPYTLKLLKVDGSLRLGVSEVAQSGYDDNEEITQPGGEYSKTIKYNVLDARVNINAIEGEGWEYKDASINVDAKQSGNKITFIVPASSMPYTLKPLQIATGALPYSNNLQKPLKFSRYHQNTSIQVPGREYNVAPLMIIDEEKYKQCYPQSLATVNGSTYREAINFAGKSGIANSITVEIYYNKGKKYEKLNGQYYIFEKVDLERFPGSEGSYNVNWTINTIDISIYDKGAENSNVYETSYIKKYLEEVVKVKMGVTSVSLPKWKGKDTMSDSQPGSYNQSALKTKKVTVYAEAVRGSYKTLRNITTNISEDSRYAQYTWLGTRYTDYSNVVWFINPSGSLNDNFTNYAFGLRPAIN